LLLSGRVGNHLLRGLRWRYHAYCIGKSIETNSSTIGQDCHMRRQWISLDRGSCVDQHLQESHSFQCCLSLLVGDRIIGGEILESLWIVSLQSKTQLYTRLEIIPMLFGFRHMVCHTDIDVL